MNLNVEAMQGQLGFLAESPTKNTFFKDVDRKTQFCAAIFFILQRCRVLAKILLSCYF